jgi:AraC family transcriptional regulator
MAVLTCGETQGGAAWEMRMPAAQICGTGGSSLWQGHADNGIAVRVIGQAQTSCAAVELHDAVFQAASETVGCAATALFDLSLSGRCGDPVGHFPDRPGQPQRPLGDLLFLPPRTRFHSRWRTGTQRTLWVVPTRTDDWADVDWSDRALDEALDMHNNELRQAMLRIARELVQPGFASALLLDALCVEVLVLLQRHLRGATGEAMPGPGALGQGQLRRIEQLVDCPGPLPSLAALAEACGISERHFSRLFRMATGQSAARFIHDRRMARARDRLAYAPAPVKQIAWEAGFESAAAFSAAFRRHSGQSPRQFRQYARGLAISTAMTGSR